MMICDNCEYYDFEKNECCYDPANPKKVTQPDAKCEYGTEKL